MKYPIFIITIILYLISTVQAGLEVTNPYKSITWKGGNKQTITWRDDNDKTSPSLKDLNSLTIGLYYGNQTNQAFVAELGKKVKGTNLKFEFKVPKNIGPQSNDYFLILSQFIGQDEYTSYSGHFSIKGVSGSIKFPTVTPGGSNSTPIGSGSPPINPGSSPTGTSDSPNSPNNPSTTSYPNDNNSSSSNTTDGYNYYGNANKIESSLFGFAGKLVIAGFALGISFIF